MDIDLTPIPQQLEAETEAEQQQWFEQRGYVAKRLDDLCFAATANDLRAERIDFAEVIQRLSRDISTRKNQYDVGHLRKWIEDHVNP